MSLAGGGGGQSLTTKTEDRICTYATTQQEKQPQLQQVKDPMSLLQSVVSGCAESDVRAMIAIERPISDSLTNVSHKTFASGSAAASSSAASSVSSAATPDSLIDGHMSSTVTTTTTTSLYNNECTAHPMTIITSTSATENAATLQAVLSPSIQTQNAVGPNAVSSAHPIQNEEIHSVGASVAQNKANQSSAETINQLKAVQPKTLFIQNLATVGTQRASPTKRTSLKINGSQTSSLLESEPVEMSDGINGSNRNPRGESPPPATKATNESVETSAAELSREQEEDADIEYEVNQYVIEEIESRATVVINLPPTFRDLLEKLISSPLMLGLVFLILAIMLLCILAEGEISLVWTLFAISMTSLLVFSGLKM